MDAGLLEARVEGRRRYYRADRRRLASVSDLLERMWNDALWRLKLAAELEATRRGPRPRRRPISRHKRPSRRRRATGTERASWGPREGGCKGSGDEVPGRQRKRR